MKYERFEDLPVWKTAIELAVKIYALTKDNFFDQPGDLRSQIRRASLSISNNIAEGFERGTTAELLAFLYISRGSAGETRSMLLFTEQFKEAAHLKSQISNCKALSESCSKQIRGWADDLQNSDIKGQRHLNERTRIQYEGGKRTAAFERQIQEIMQKARPQDFVKEEE
jgi:four helix bundle protein